MQKSGSQKYIVQGSLSLRIANQFSVDQSGVAIGLVQSLGRKIGTLPGADRPNTDDDPELCVNNPPSLPLAVQKSPPFILRYTIVCSRSNTLRQPRHILVESWKVPTRKTIPATLNPSRRSRCQTSPNLTRHVSEIHCCLPKQFSKK